MAQLTNEQIQFIKEKINNSEIQSQELKDDLIDHFCCFIEDEVTKGSDFSSAYEKAYYIICPDGFDELENETFFLLNHKKIKFMKRIIYISAYLSAIVFASSIVFKIQHWPYASYLLISSAVIFSLIFSPIFLVHRYHQGISRVLSKKLKYVFGYLSLSFFVFFLVFSWMHYPGASIMLIISVVLLNFGFFPFLFFRMYKKSIN